MAFESTVDTFPNTSAPVVTGYRDHIGKFTVSLRRNSIVSLYADDFVLYDWENGGIEKVSYAVFARSTSGDHLIAFRSDDRAARETWMRNNAQTWLGYL